MKHDTVIPIVGGSEQTQAIRHLIRLLAPSVSTVLITGESGTGKELVAQALHLLGPRREAPFVPINCGAIPRDLLESELFGHKKGAFTGAVADRVGTLEAARGGTVFLDEIGDMPPEMQVKLLRVLQDRKVQPIGAHHSVSINIRIIAATHKDLEKEVAEGRFREDLYYRLNVLPFRIAPLRERVTDVPELLDYYAHLHAPQGVEPVTFSSDLMGAMMAYAWPGNIRELSNLVDRFTTLMPGQTIGLLDLPAAMLPAGLVIMRNQMVADRFLSPDTGLGVHAGLNVFDGLYEGEAAIEVRDSSDEAGDPTWDAMTVSTALSTRQPHAQGVSISGAVLQLPPEGLPLKQELVNIERTLIEQALLRTCGNISKTARLLQLQRTTLIEKINKYELRAD